MATTGGATWLIVLRRLWRTLKRKRNHSWNNNASYDFLGGLATTGGGEGVSSAEISMSEPYLEWKMLKIGDENKVLARRFQSICSGPCEPVRVPFASRRHPCRRTAALRLPRFHRPSCWPSGRRSDSARRRCRMPTSSWLFFSLSTRHCTSRRDIPAENCAHRIGLWNAEFEWRQSRSSYFGTVSCSWSAIFNTSSISVWIKRIAAWTKLLPLGCGTTGVCWNSSYVFISKWMMCCY